MSEDSLLTLRGFGARFGDHVVLAHVDLDLPARGMTVLVGPVGSGKSTLLRTIAGLNDAHPALATWGTATFRDQPLALSGTPAPGETRPGIGFVMQQARFFIDSVRENLVSCLANRGSLDPGTQTRWVIGLLEAQGLGKLANQLDDDVASLDKPVQRRLALVRALAFEPALLFADEPTAGLDDENTLAVLTLLQAEAAKRSIMMVTHNQKLARAAGGNTVLLAGGRCQEIAKTADFFARPRTRAAQLFVRTGGCAEPSPDAQPEALRPSVPPPPALPPLAVARSRAEGPRGFFWARVGQLGGVPRPGIVNELERDLEALERLGITVLVTLEESATVPRHVLAQRGIDLIHFPIVDMGAPTLESAAALCQRVERLTAQGSVVAFHCRAGLGRTGTLLAAQLVFEGLSASRAIERIRALNPRCIQSEAQIQFLSAFDASVAGERRRSLRAKDRHFSEQYETSHPITGDNQHGTR
jgi:atypical dual specificity phosphatase